MRFVSIWVTMMMVLAVGFDPIAADKSTQKKELVRLSFAKEVHGKEFTKSAVFNQSKSEKEISKKIRAVINENLPEFSTAYRKQFQTVLEKESYQAKMDPMYILAMIQTESKFNPRAKGTVGELGLMQVKPSTAKWLDEEIGEYSPKKKIDLYDPITNIQYGIRYLTYLRSIFPKDALKYINAYNRGPAKAKKLSTKRVEKFYAKVGKNNKNKHLLYSDRILANYNGLNSETSKSKM